MAATFDRNCELDIFGKNINATVERWTDGLGIAASLLLLFASVEAGRCQDLGPKLHIESSAGIFSTDNHLAFETSPSFGLGTGYHITNTLQLNLVFSYIPTQQRLSQATSKLTAKFALFDVQLGMRFSWHKAVMWRLRPFASIGGGVLTINPHRVQLSLGGGQSTRVEPPVTHRIAVNLGGGLILPLNRSLSLRLELSRFYYKLDMSASSTDSVIARSNHMRIGVVVGL